MPKWRLVPGLVLLPLVLPVSLSAQGPTTAAVQGVPVSAESFPLSSRNVPAAVPATSVSLWLMSEKTRGVCDNPRVIDVDPLDRMNLETLRALRAS